MLDALAGPVEGEVVVGQLQKLVLKLPVREPRELLKVGEVGLCGLENSLLPSQLQRQHHLQPTVSDEREERTEAKVDHLVVHFEVEDVVALVVAEPVAVVP